MGFIINPYFNALVVSPLDFPGLVRWYKADTYALSDGDRVGGVGREWIDQSVSAVNATQSVAGNRPYYKANAIGSMPAVQFDVADNSWLEMVGLVLAGDFTIIGIVNPLGSTTLVGSLTQNIWVRLLLSGPTLDLYDGASGHVSDVITSYDMASWRRNGAGDIIFRERNIARGTVAGSVVSLTYTELGGTTGGGGGNSALGELCIWNTLLSDANIDLLYTNYFKYRFPAIP